MYSWWCKSRSYRFISAQLTSTVFHTSRSWDLLYTMQVARAIAPEMTQVLLLHLGYHYDIWWCWRAQRDWRRKKAFTSRTARTPVNLFHADIIRIHNSAWHRQHSCGSHEFVGELSNLFCFKLVVRLNIFVYTNSPNTSSVNSVSQSCIWENQISQ